MDGVATAAPVRRAGGRLFEAAGASFASGIRDALRILSSLMEGRDTLKPKSAALLGPAMLTQMHRVQVQLPAHSVLAKAWGLGWYVDPELDAVAHMGGTSAFVLGFPGKKRLCVCLSNTPNGAEAAKAAFQEIFSLPKPTPTPRTPDPDMHAVVGRYASPTFKIEVLEDSGRLFAITSFSPNPVELHPVGRRAYLARLSSGREAVETEVIFLGDGATPSHMYVALRALRRIQE